MPHPSMPHPSMPHAPVLGASASTVRRRLAAVAVALSAGVLAACGGDPEPTADAGRVDAAPIRVERTAVTAAAPSRRAIAGCDGTWITPGRPASRVLSLRNYATELLVGLGAGDRVVGQVHKGQFEPLPELRTAYEEVPVVAEDAPSQEQVLGARPDLVVGDGSWAFDGKSVPTQADLAASGVAPYVIPTACTDARHPQPSFDDVFAMISELGTLTGTERRAGQLERWGRQRTAATTRLAREQGEPTVVAGGVSDGAFYAYDRGSYAPTLEVLGARNALPRGTVKADATFAQVSTEQILRWNPDALLLTYLDADLPAQKAYVQRRLGRLDAVREGRVAYVPDAFFTGGLRTLVSLPRVAFALRGAPVPAELADTALPKD